jgi:hypothetical protein
MPSFLLPAARGKTLSVRPSIKGFDGLCGDVLGWALRQIAGLWVAVSSSNRWLRKGCLSRRGETSKLLSPRMNWKTCTRGTPFSRKPARRRTANRVAELFREGLARKEALRARKAAEATAARFSSSSSSRPALSTWPRRRTKFYAIRKARKIGIFDTWEECERYTKGVSSEFKSFATYEEASAYLVGRRLNFMAFRRSPKPPSSFVGGTGVRARIDVWQDGYEDALRVDCALDTMSDVNLALSELLHDVHEIVVDDVQGTARLTTFAKEGTLKILHDGEVICLPALVAVASQLPRSCDVLLGVPA